ncbi:MAG TPA: dual specificity protein phosphatase family protein [Pirellulales bacterium]|nr:dual specificity protein phosphatase family protein [Pirellulales bacterium]
MSLHIARGAMLALVLFCSLSSSARAMNLYKVTTGVFRGSTPETAADFDRLKQMGIKTVLNLRRFDRNAIARERQALTARGIRHVHVPIRYFPRGDNSIDHAVNVLSDTTLHPVYVHCKHGHDRCGTVVGLYKVRHHGWSAEAAYRDMRQYGFNERLGGLRRYYWSAAGRMRSARPTTPTLLNGERAIAANNRTPAQATRMPPNGSNPAAVRPPAIQPVVAKPVVAKPAVATPSAAKPAAIKPLSAPVAATAPVATRVGN